MLARRTLRSWSRSLLRSAVFHLRPDFRRRSCQTLSPSSQVASPRNLGSSLMTTVHRGTFLHALSRDSVELFTGSVGVDVVTGTITFVARSDADFNAAKDAHKFNESDVIDHHNRIIVPGFVDTHAHAPQYVFTGTGTGVPLLEWLNKYTFNYESKYKELDFAEDVYTKAVSRFMKNGSTTTCYFATIHRPASELLANICEQKGQRAFIGKVNMDRNSPDHYIEQTQSSIDDTLKFIEFCQNKNNALITPILTPRFVPSCTPELMRELGNLARKFDLPIQSHISENQDEVAWIKSLHPDLNSYTDVYDHFGLLTNKTIMAHGIHLGEDELKTFAQKGASIAHCPVSNFTMVSGMMPARKIQRHNVTIGLGTDVSGGYSPSMLQTIRLTLHNSATLQHCNGGPEENGPVMKWQEGFFLATQGGADALGLGKTIGSFVPGKAFDALIVDHHAKNGPYDVFGGDSDLEKFEKFIFLGDDRNIVQVYVAGKKVIDA